MSDIMKKAIVLRHEADALCDEEKYEEATVLYAEALDLYEKYIMHTSGKHTIFLR